MKRRETEKDQTECWCDGWVIDSPPEQSRKEPTNRRSPSCPSANRCRLGKAAAGSGTRGRSLVRTAHFDRVACILAPVGVGTVVGGIQEE